MKSSVAELIGTWVIAILIVVGLAIVFSFPTKWLWNWLMPTLFSLPRITVWEAMGLNLLSNILFKSSRITKTDD